MGLVWDLEFVIWDLNLEDLGGVGVYYLGWETPTRAVAQMKTLLHICCANCAIYPLERMEEKGDDVTGFFFNPNIHPYQEYQKRLDALKQYSQEVGLKVIYRDEYLLEAFLRNVSHRVEERCQYCYSVRLEATAYEAKDKAFDGFSTTLLQSTHQNHALIKETGERIAQAIGIRFYYEDFRQGWRRGLEVSKSLGLYRQQYCGCIYSEKERFMRPSPSPLPHGERIKVRGK